jgi:hypothetical protein
MRAGVSTPVHMVGFNACIMDMDSNAIGRIVGGVVGILGGQRNLLRLPQV